MAHKKKGHFESREMLEMWVIDLYFELNRRPLPISRIVGERVWTVNKIIKEERERVPNAPPE